MTNSPKVTILILHYGSTAETFTCLDSCLNLSYDNFNIALIDNDPSQNLKREFCEKNNVTNLDSIFLKNREIFIFETSDNLGFSGGFNYGIDNIKRYVNIDCAWLLNNDIEVTKDSLNNLVKFISLPENHNVGITGSAIQTREKLNETFYGGYLDLKKGLVEPIILNHKNQESLNIEINKHNYYACHGAAMLLNFNILPEKFRLPEKYFLSYEEMYLSRHLNKIDLRMTTCYESNLIHSESTNTSKVSKYYIYYINRNKLAFYLEYFPKYFIIILFKDAVFPLMLNTLKGKFKKSLWLAQAIIDCFLVKASFKPFFGK